jgi:hypothetical protein
VIEDKQPLVLQDLLPIPKPLTNPLLSPRPPPPLDTPPPAGSIIDSNLLPVTLTTTS